MKIAIIGSGISGLGAAWLLHRKHDITVFEKNAYAGGHSNTAEVVWPADKIGGASATPALSGKASAALERIIKVDTGFIVYNERNYPHLTQLFKTLEVAVEKSDMTFGVSVNDGELEYSSQSLRGLLAQPGNLFRADFWQMIRDILRFNRQAPQLLKEPDAAHITLGQYLRQHGYSQSFIGGWILPVGAAIWSSTQEKMLSFPAFTFIRFFHNHGLLTINDQPQWYTVTGGSCEYVKKLTAGFSDKIRLNTPALSITRDAEGVTLTSARGEERFDQVVIAAHADQALGLLRDPSEDEREILGAFPYQPNRAVLHSDASFMPRRRAVWSSWNYLSQAQTGKDHMVLTYWMNRLQNIDRSAPLFVTLNPPRQPERIHGEFLYEHPLYTEAGIKAQARLDDIQGVNRTWYCGAYHRYGFHEDGLSAGIQVANGLGVLAPWQR